MVGDIRPPLIVAPCKQVAMPFAGRCPIHGPWRCVHPSSGCPVGCYYPQRFQRSRKRGARLPERTVCVSRGTRWGNPFKLENESERAEVVSKFAIALAAGSLGFSKADVRRELAWKNLACWCSTTKTCHAEELLRVANSIPRERFYRAPEMWCLEVPNG